LPRHVPMNLEDMQIDWQKIREGQGMKKVLVGAVDKQIVQDYINLCCLAGLEVVALEIEAQAIARSIILNGRRQKKMDRGWNKIFKRDLKEEKVGYNKTTKNPKMILDLGATRTSVILFDEGVVQFTNSLGNISGEQITNTIIDRKRLSYLEAEKAKLICGTNSKKCKGIVRDVMKETIDNIAREIINGDEFYKTHFGKESANLEVWLCGGGANMLGLTEALEGKLHRKVKVADPLINIEETLAEQHKNLSAYATAIGLALRNF